MRFIATDRGRLAARALLILAALGSVSRVAAQVPDSAGVGVAIGSAYGTGGQQLALAFKPFEGRFGGLPVANRVETIMARDLKNSDRYKVMDSIPAALIGSGPVDYSVWERVDADWLLTGTVEGSGSTFVLRLQLHDVVFKKVQNEQQFTLPAPESPDFRMAVHRISDQIVMWTNNEPGMAASRIAWSAGTNGIKELYVADSDGQNVERLTNYRNLVLGMAWSPDGNRIVYSALPLTENQWGIYEMDLSTKRSTKLPIVREGGLNTPTYDPTGQIVAFSVQGGARSGLYTYNVARRCCLTNLVESSKIESSPTYSPDGRWLAFNSDRFGSKWPQIFRMPAAGGDAEPITPYFQQKGYYTSPEWTPRGDQVAFHGRITEYGDFQIYTARPDQPGTLKQLTNEGNNEDPSWAPDGRHIVFISERREGRGLYIVDTVTGTIRPFITGIEARPPSWSPALKPGSGGL